MSRVYHVFAGDTYYPAGGYGDYVGSFPTLEEARFQAKRKKPRFDGVLIPAYDWWEILCSQEGSLALAKVDEGRI